MKKCIKNVLEEKDNSKIFHSSNKPRKYSNSDLYDEDPKLKRNMQIRSLELIIRMLFASCLIESKKSKSSLINPLEPEKIYKDIIKRIKDLTRHFVLLYICKNGRLVNKVNDDFCPEELELLASEDIEVGSNSFLKMTLTEINPLIFIDIV